MQMLTRGLFILVLGLSYASCISATPWTVSSPKGLGGSKVIKGFRAPFGIYVDQDGNLYVPDLDEGRVIRFDKELKFTGWLGMKKESKEPSGWHQRGTPLRGLGRGEMQQPHAVVIDGKGNLYVSDYDRQDRIHKYDASGAYLTDVFKGGLGPVSVFIDKMGNFYVCDFNLHRVTKFNAAGEFMGWLGAAEKQHFDGFKKEGVSMASTNLGGFSKPHMVHVDSAGYIYVVEMGNNRIQRFAPDGRFMGWIGINSEGVLVSGWAMKGQSAASKKPGGFDEPTSITMDEKENIFVAEVGNHRIQKFSKKGEFLGWMGGGDARQASDGWSKDGLSLAGDEIGQFRNPYDVKAVKGFLYVADGYNRRVQIILYD